jgi:hypothetical protein
MVLMRFSLSANLAASLRRFIRLSDAIDNFSRTLIRERLSVFPPLGEERTDRFIRLMAFHYEEGRFLDNGTLHSMHIPQSNTLQFRRIREISIQMPPWFT